MDEYIILGIIIGITIIFFTTTYICYRMTFFSKKRPLKSDKIILPDQGIYALYTNQIKNDILDAEKMPYKSLSVISHDGLTLRGKFYEYQKNAPIEIMFHGYRSNGKRDMYLMGMCKQKEYRHQVFVARGGCQRPNFSRKILEAPDLLRGHFHVFVNIWA